jgi:hypothetical protein
MGTMMSQEQRERILSGYKVACFETNQAERDKAVLGVRTSAQLVAAAPGS